MPTNVYVGPRSPILSGFSNNAGKPILFLGRALPAARSPLLMQKLHGHRQVRNEPARNRKTKNCFIGPFDNSQKACAFSYYAGCTGPRDQAWCRGQRDTKLPRAQHFTGWPNCLSPVARLSCGRNLHHADTANLTSEMWGGSINRGLTLGLVQQMGHFSGDNGSSAYVFSRDSPSR